MVSFSFWAIESTHWLFVLISHFPCSLCAFVFTFVCFSACFYVECLSLTEAVDKQPSITLKVYKLSSYQRWFFLRSTQADFASSSPPTSAAAAFLSVCLSVLFLPVCISLWYFVCGQIKHKPYIIFVIFSPHGTFLATIFLHTKARKSRQNRFHGKTA